MKNEWYRIQNADQLDTPALVVYPDRVKHNIAAAIEMIGDVARLRPHVKTHKCAEITKLMLDAGITKFKCATIAEAEMLGICKAPDVLLAYQPAGPKLKRFVQLIKNYPKTKFSCLVDNILAAVEVSEIAVKNKVVVHVYIDLNVGQNRTGMSPQKKENGQNAALKLYVDCDLLQNVKPAGLHAYDGHIHHPDMDERKAVCDECYEPVEKLQVELKKLGYYPIVVAGGSPTYPIHLKRKHIECSPGTFVYWDAGYQAILAEQEFLPAALLLTRVISLPDETKICLDLGHKSVAAENDLGKRVSFLNGPGLAPVGQSEEHLVLDAGEGHHYKIGDILYGMPYHICPTVALYERVVTVENEKTAVEWKNIARDRKITV